MAAYLLWFGHVVDHQNAQAVQHTFKNGVLAWAQRAGDRAGTKRTAPNAHPTEPAHTIACAGLPLGLGVVELPSEVRPELQTGLEDVFVLDTGDADHVQQRLHHHCLMQQGTRAVSINLWAFEEGQEGLEVGAQQQRQALHEQAVFIGAVLVCAGEIRSARDDDRQALDHMHQ